MYIKNIPNTKNIRPIVYKNVYPVTNPAATFGSKPSITVNVKSINPNSTNKIPIEINALAPISSEFAILLNKILKYFKPSYGHQTIINKMERAKIYDLIDFIEDPQTKSNILTYFDLVLGITSEEGKEWNEYKTRSGTRFVNEIQFDQGQIIIPGCFSDINKEIETLVLELLKVARLTVIDGSEMIPLQLFLCYYRNGNDVCPMHSHKCRQITLSIGADRVMTVGSKKINLYNGSVIYLNTEKHGILKEDSVEGNRVSFNLFYTTSTELQGVQ